MSAGMTTAFTTGLTTISTTVMDLAGIALPIGMGIFGMFLAVKLGMKFFKTVTN